MNLISALVALALPAADGVKGVEVTVYNQNFGLVKEIREVNFAKGISTVAVADVASLIDPTSVHFRALKNPDAVEILEQNYRFDLLSPNSVLEKSVGKKVRLHRVLPNGSKETVEGTLLTPPSQGIIVKADDGRTLLNPTGEIEVLSLPEGLIARPTLFWEVNSDVAGSQDAELSYIADGLNWEATYVATINKDDTALDLGGWVTLTNTCGATYRDARLKLVAGDVRRQPRYRQMPQGGFGGGGRGAMKDEAAGFTESGLFEYHLYTLGRPTTIRDKETKQVALLSASNVTARKLLIYEGQGIYWQQYGPNYRPGDGEDTDANRKVNVEIVFVNSKQNSMGMPLPKGQVRVYKRDESGQLQFVGEDSIDHTPRDEKVKLFIGNAFDVVASRKRTDYKVIAANIIRQSFQISVRNRKQTESVTVQVAEHPWGDWTVLEKSMDFEKQDAHTINFMVDVPAGKEKIVTYTVESRFW